MQAKDQHGRRTGKLGTRNPTLLTPRQPIIASMDRFRPPSTVSPLLSRPHSIYLMGLIHSEGTNTVSKEAAPHIVKVVHLQHAKTGSGGGGGNASRPDPG